MSNAYGNQQLPPGWYADPAGSPQLRWWDGTQWTEHLHAPAAPGSAPVQGYGSAPVQGYASAPVYGNAPVYGAAPVYAGAAQYPSVAPGTPVYGPLIWIITLLPLVSLLLLPFVLTNVNDMMRQVAADPYSYSGGYSGSMLGIQLVSNLFSLLLYGAVVVLAYFDHKRLRALGYVRPFHWAWAFLSSAVYVIGRSVVVRRRAGHGIAPMWVMIGVLVVSFIVSIVVIVSIFSTMMSSFSSISTGGSYT